MTGYFYFSLFWGDLLVSVSFITADESRRKEPAETSETGGKMERKRGREGKREGGRKGGNLFRRSDSPSRLGMSLLAKDQ